MILNAQQIAKLPLFIGLTDIELDEIVRDIHLDIKHYKKGRVFVNEYDACTSLLFVQNGWFITDTYSDNRSFHLEELAQGPQIIEPDKLFGLSKHYHSTYTAYTPCDILCLPKEGLMMLLEKYIIIRINFLNTISRKSQRLEASSWQNNCTDVKGSVIMFIRQHSIYPVGKKTLYIKMTQLADETHFSRLEISNALNALHNEDKIILKRGIVEVPALQLL